MSWIWSIELWVHPVCLSVCVRGWFWAEGGWLVVVSAAALARSMELLESAECWLAPGECTRTLLALPSVLVHSGKTLRSTAPGGLPLLPRLPSTLLVHSLHSLVTLLSLLVHFSVDVAMRLQLLKRDTNHCKQWAQLKRLGYILIKLIRPLWLLPPSAHHRDKESMCHKTENYPLHYFIRIKISSIKNILLILSK